MLLLVFTIIYWIFAIFGTLSMSAKLDTEKILPKDSPIQEPNRIISNMVWTEYYPLTVIINNPLDITSKIYLKRFYSLVNEFESLKKCKGIFIIIISFKNF